MTGLVDILGGNIIESVGKVVTDLVTTDKERLQLGLQQQELDQKGNLAQIDVNKTEAASARFWVAGWRPGVGWVGVLALFFAYVPKCIMLTALWSYQASVLVYAWRAPAPMPVLPAFPDLGIMDIVGLLTSMLGMGYMRHKEKMAGVAASGISDGAPAVGPANQPEAP